MHEMILKMASKNFDLDKRTLIMGILNITPDSFSDGGQFNSIEAAVRHAKEMEKEGADILDIGGESTRPDHEPISAEAEIERIIPIIKAVRNAVSLPISIDTYKAKTAEAAILAGADMINDIWGAKADSSMAKVAATYDVPIVLMHNRDHKTYDHLVDDIVSELQESIDIVKAEGVSDAKIVLDPGIGFGKTLSDNYEVLRHLNRIIERLPYPILLGTSRKSFITEVLELPADKRDNASGATTCLGIAQGVHIVRVHDVKRHYELARMTDRIIGRT